MVDTIRDKAAMLALLADNTSGDITEQVLRDMFVSLRKSPHGRFSLSGAAVDTVVGVAGTYYKVLGTTALSGDETDFDANSLNNRLRYTGLDEIHAHLAISVSMTATSNNQVMGLQIAKNGVIQPNTRVRHKHTTGTAIGSTAIHGDFHMVTNDYLELFVTKYTTGTNVKIEDLYVFVLGMYAA